MLEDLSTLAVTRVSPDVLARSAAFSGHIQGVHRVAAYVAVDGTDDLVVLALDAVGGVPGGALIGRLSDLRTIGLERGMAVTARAGRVSIPRAGVSIDLAGARPWSGSLPATAACSPGPALRRRIATARALAATAAPRGGFAPLLGGPRGSLPSDRRHGGDFAAAARPRVAALAAGLMDGDVARTTRAVSSLIGLGPGLTPSGDDLLVGLLAGLEATGHPLLAVLATTIASQAPGGTTSVGASALRNAARGQFAERLHDVLVAVARPDAAGLPRAIERGMACGSTSGADTLVGVFTALDAASDVVRPEARSAA